MEAEDFQEELTCAICLDYFEDPVSIECGHNFCRGCLCRTWAPGGSPVRCPECRRPSAPASMRPNWALARLTERIRRRRLGPVPAGLCGRHWEPLRLFCEDDQRLVCLVCRESQEHQAHTMAPADEAFKSYREKLLKTQSSLTAKMKKVMHFQDMEVKNAAEWKEKMKNQRMRVIAEFAKLHVLLTEEEQLFLQGLRQEEEETKKKQSENIFRLNQMITSLKTLILEVKEKSQGSTLELLQNPAEVLTRCENQDVSYSSEDLTVKTVCRLPMMKEMLKRFQGREIREKRSIRQFLATVFYSVELRYRMEESEDHRLCGEIPAFAPAFWEKVFSLQGSITGRSRTEAARRWLRECVGRTSWDCPVVQQCAPRWESGLFVGVLRAIGPLTGSSVSPTKREPALQRVGVFLDHGAREVSFYNAVDGEYLHTFSCSSSSRLRPFFWLSPLASVVIPQ